MRLLLDLMIQKCTYTVVGANIVKLIILLTLICCPISMCMNYITVTTKR